MQHNNIELVYINFNRLVKSLPQSVPSPNIVHNVMLLMAPGIPMFIQTLSNTRSCQAKTHKMRMKQITF